MATIKSYSDLQQSKKLEEILPLESADYHYIVQGKKSYFYPYSLSSDAVKDYDEEIKYIPCWSLAALLGVLEHPRCFQGDKPTYWFCGCFGKDKLYHEVEAGNPVDACYKLILELHKLNLL